MVIDHIFSTIAFLSNKNRRGVLKHQDINLAVKSAMLNFYNDELKIYREAGIITTPLKRFVKTSTVALTTGVGSLPADFVKEVSFIGDATGEGDFVTHEAFYDRKRSCVLTPSSEFPIAKIQNSQVVVEPTSVASIAFTYLRTPVDFAYSVTVDGDGRGYTIAGTTDIEISLDLADEIIRRACLYLGIASQNKDTAQLGAQQ